MDRVAGVWLNERAGLVDEEARGAEEGTDYATSAARRGGRAGMFDHHALAHSSTLLNFVGRFLGSGAVTVGSSNFSLRRRWT